MDSSARSCSTSRQGSNPLGHEAARQGPVAQPQDSAVHFGLHPSPRLDEDFLQVLSCFLSPGMGKDAPNTLAHVLLTSLDRPNLAKQGMSLALHLADMDG
jgi:hypothetical protein